MKEFKQCATNFLARFERFEDMMNNHVTLNKASPHYPLKVPPLFSVWQQLRNNVQNPRKPSQIKEASSVAQITLKAGVPYILN